MAHRRQDAFAILLAAHHPALRLLGISTVHGNASLQSTTANAGRLLAAMGASAAVPVYAGAARPFCRAPVHAPHIHGATGLDGTDLLPAASAAAPPRTDAPWLLAARAALLAERAPWVVATGALTNVALLFAAFPELVAHVGGLSIMGGALGEPFSRHGSGTDDNGRPQRLGNITPWAEFNVYCDPEAAAALLANPALAAKTVLVPLDLTHQVLATPAVQRLLLHGPDAAGPVAPAADAADAPGPSRLRRMLHHLLIFYTDTYVHELGIRAGPPLHDPVAVAAVLQAVGAEALGFAPAPAPDAPGALGIAGNDDDGSSPARWVVRVVTEPGAGIDEGAGGRDRARAGELGRTRAQRARAGEAGVCVPARLDVPAFWRCLEAAMARADAQVRAQGEL